MLPEDVQITLPCPKCGTVLAVKVNGITGQQFLACPRFPACKHSQSLPAYLEIKLAGGTSLPGFDEDDEGRVVT